ncbi:hypothetical protein J6590_015244 [Homalodisca vitripennis]|nr:hypothetical protein J6590_015244 [Homalodisca vitripennis]
MKKLLFLPSKQTSQTGITAPAIQVSPLSLNSTRSRGCRVFTCYRHIPVRLESLLPRPRFHPSRSTPREVEVAESSPDTDILLSDWNHCSGDPGFTPLAQLHAK